MLEFGAPSWLLGLPAIAVIWWLHRMHSDPVTVSVSSLLMWQALEETPETGGHIRNRADPVWLLRALIALLIILALAQPFWKQSRASIVVWFDTSLSMRAIEGDQPRWQTAARDVVNQLVGESAGEISIRSLGNPDSTLALTGTQGDQQLEVLGQWLRDQPPAEPVWPANIDMNSAARHWLVTDGASTGYPEWLSDSPVTRILQVGTTTDNVAVTRLTLRPSLVRPSLVRPGITRISPAGGDTWQGVIAITNTGEQPADREARLTVDGRTHSQWPLRLGAGQTVERTFRLDAATNLVEVALAPSDALAEDDRLQAAVQNNQSLRYVVGEHCGPALRSALSAHPRLRPVPDRPDLRIICTDSHSAAATVSSTEPVLLLHNSGPALPVAESPRWTDEAGALGELFLLPEWLALSRADFTETSGQPILDLGGQPVIIFHRGPNPVVEVLLDMENPGLVARPEYPVLVGGLLDTLFGRALLDPVVGIERDPAPSIIQPQKLSAPARAATSRQSEFLRAMQSTLLTIAAILLLVDVLILIFRGRGRIRSTSHNFGAA